MKCKFLPTIAFALFSLSVSAIDTATGIFDNSFRSLKVQRSDNFFAPPVLMLGGDDLLTITFDRLTEDRDFLRFRLLHCNSDWQPSQLVESEYMTGFNDVEIEDYAFSQSTFTHYVNYRIEFPLEQCTPLVSGNYLLQVYDEAEPDETLLQCRFCVSEESVIVSASADAYTDRGINDIYQQLAINLDIQKAEIKNPYTDIVVTVEQNYASSPQIVLRNPQRVQGSEVIYEHMPQLIIQSGNEYRRFETVRADYPGMNVDSVRYVAPNYHAYLRRDIPGREREYNYDQTQAGRFMVREYNATDADLGADYITVHFALQSDQFTAGEVYVDGEMTLGRFNDTNRMYYDAENCEYRLEMLLKQGSYNYRYVVKNNGEFDPYFIDGNKYETRNEYMVKVYVRNPGERADRLVGTSLVMAYK